MKIETAKAFFICILLLCATELFAGELTVEALDVGQADALLVRVEDKIVLIDAGEKKTQAYDHLKNRGIEKINMVVASHAHLDHIGGMEKIIRAYDVGVFMDNGLPFTSATYNKLMQAVEEKVNAGQMKYMIAKKGKILNLGSEARFEVLLPGDDTFRNTRSDANANSVILKLTHGDNCMLFMGDAEAETEERLVADGLGKCAFLKVSHHGSNHSSVEPFIRAVEPEIAFISCGLANKHGHPGMETLDRLKATGTSVYRTDLSGTLKLISDGKMLRVEEEHPPIEPVQIDINLADATDLKKLPGVGATTAQKILDYRQQNGKFKTLEDLYSVPGIGKGKVRKIIPFATVGNANEVHSISDFNLNLADFDALVSVGGFSMTEANDILKFKRELGGFKQCDELYALHSVRAEPIHELCGNAITIPSAVAFTSIEEARKYSRPHLAYANALNANGRGTQLTAPPIAESKMVTSPSYTVLPSSTGAAVKRVNINTASLDEIASMPGISAKKARAVIDYRNNAGPFASCSDLVKVKGIGVKTVEKVSGSCTVN